MPVTHSLPRNRRETLGHGLIVSKTSKRHLDESLFPLPVPEESVNSARHTVFGQPGLLYIAEAPAELGRAVTEGSATSGPAL